MKHNLKITVVIVVMFIISMLLGLVVINSYDRYFGKTSQKIAQEAAEKNITIEKPDISFVQETVPPPMEPKRTIDVINILVSILIAIAIAVGLFLLLSKIKIHLFIKGWFAIVIFICLVVALTLLLYYIFGSQSLFNFFGKKISIAEMLALPIAFVLTYFKIKKGNSIIHNVSELFVYPGLAVIFIPILNVLAAAILLILISVYDMIAVWKTKHMQAMAKFQIEYLKIFTGFLLPYTSKKDKVKIKKLKLELKKIKSKKKQQAFLKKQKIKVNIAALGGGDVAFPLIFIGTILLSYGLTAAFTVVGTTTLALALLLIFAKKGKFYPAMPFLSAGCFLGLLLVLI
ncbi:MAG: presenilin family intramembrane aspartyl protease [Candidatus Pacearchaeota archaeon]